MEKKYMMNLSAIRAHDAEKYEFLVSEVEVPFFSGNNVPVVDITSGRIYGSIILDNCWYFKYGGATLRNRIIESITNGTPVKNMEYLGDKISQDNYGTDITGHLFMDVGSVDLATLKAIWKSYKKREETKKKEADKAKKAEQLLNEANNLLTKVDSLIEEAKELMKN